jgi:hypothetical protein
MENWIAKVLTAVKKYTVWDLGWLKIAVLSFGLLLGAYFPLFFLSIAGLLWLIFLLSGAWILYQTFVKYMG